MAYIYLITNTINGKKYIGKTNFTPEHRFREHLRALNRRKCEKRPLYSAMRKYGPDKFSLSVIEECSESDSASREKYWISKLKTFGSNGYNATFGGDGKNKYNHDEIRSLILSGVPFHDVVSRLGCDPLVVRNACKGLGINFADAARDTVREKCGRPVYMIDEDGLPLLYFRSTGDAFIWCANNGHSTNSKTNGAAHISAAALGRRKTAYGFKWVYLTGLSASKI